MVARKNELRRLNSWRCESDSIRLVNILAPPAAGAIRVEEAEGLDTASRVLFPLFGVRRLVAAFSWFVHNQNAVGRCSRRREQNQSGDKSPHSKFVPPWTLSFNS